MASRAQVIPSPVEFSEASIQDNEKKKKIRTELDVSQKTLLVGWVANWMARKRPHVFVDMAARIAKTYNGQVAFPMFGEPRKPVRDEVLRRIKEHGLEGQVLVMGTKNPIEPWIAGCDVLVATAVNEGQGRTLIEAMLVGTPVVASAHGGHLEVIEHGITGILVPPDDPEAFSEAVLGLLADSSSLQEIVLNAERHARNTYSVTRHVEKILSVYGLSGN